jgi:rRNA maturation endonuclease Nob1
MSRATQLDLSGKPAAIRWRRELGEDGLFRYVCQRCGNVFRRRGQEPAHPCAECTAAEKAAARAERKARRDALERQRQAQIGMFPDPEAG